MGVRVWDIFHYTDERGLRKILSKKEIELSSNHPTGYINGINVVKGAVFFTRYSPKHHREFLARNNFNNSWRKNIDKVKCYIRCQIPEYGNNDGINLIEAQIPFIDDAKGKSRNVVAYLRGKLKLTNEIKWSSGYTDEFENEHACVEKAQLERITLCTYNVHHKTMVEQVAQVLKDNPADIITLQECNEETAKQIRAKLGPASELDLTVGQNCAILSR